MLHMPHYNKNWILQYSNTCYWNIAKIMSWGILLPNVSDNIKYPGLLNGSKVFLYDKLGSSEQMNSNICHTKSKMLQKES